MILHLVQQHPSLSADDMIANLVPPHLFQGVSFDSYRPDPDYPSQQEAVDELRTFAERWRSQPRRGWFGRSRHQQPEAAGIYLDGGFGVGKTHLLASLWNIAPGPKAYGTFLEYTSLVGALGFDRAVEQLRGYRLLCIDEFELDDPGDTMIMTRLLKTLAASGSSIVATSNTPPNALGEGRFAASDFMREIQSLSSIFRAIRIDGEDYRRRDTAAVAEPWEPHQIDDWLAEVAETDLRVSDDPFADVVAHVATLHPVQYFALARAADVYVWRDVARLARQDQALRMVALIDRIYDEERPIIATGIPLTSMFGSEMLEGGYRKKYLRCLSRLDALTALGRKRFGGAESRV